MATTAKSRRRLKTPKKPAPRKVPLVVPSGSGVRPDPPTRLRIVRTAKGLTLVQLAQKLRVNHALLSQIENGLLTPTPTFVERLSVVLDADAKTLGFPRPKEVLHVG